MKDELREAMENALAAGITDEALEAYRKKMNDAMSEEEDRLIWHLKDELAMQITDWVDQMVGRAIKALLAGEWKAMAHAMGCEEGTFTGRGADTEALGILRGRHAKEWHAVIHGKLSEHPPLTIRRDIASAHRDLIEQERIKDLEDQVASLVAQVNADAIGRARRMLSACRHHLHSSLEEAWTNEETSDLILKVDHTLEETR